MNRRIFYLSCIALLSLVFCKRKDEIDSKSPTTEPKNLLAGEPKPVFVNIPDVNFRAYLKRLPALKGAFTGDRLNAADKSVISLENLKVSGEEIKDLSGIAYFTALKELDCSTNALTDLDLSQNQALTALHCQNNQLKALDLTHNNHLKSLEFFGNDDLSLENTQLGYLDATLKINTGPEGSGESFVAFPDKNFRAFLKSDVPTLENAFQGDWINLNSDLLNRVTSITAEKKQIRDLSGIEYFKKLTSLHCSDNSLGSLDVSQNPNLTGLNCSNNPLGSLDMRANTKLTSLVCLNNSLTSLDVRANTELIFLYCGTNQLTELDVSKNPNLQYFGCEENQLTELDVRANTELQHLHCDRNKLTSLDVSQNRKLMVLNCSDNSLGSLDLSQNPKVGYLECTNNKLPSLDLSAIEQNFWNLKYCGNPGLKPEKIIWGDLPKRDCKGNIIKD